VFYQSHENTGYVGEAKITRIELNEDPFSFFDVFGDAIFLTREEVQEYLDVQAKWKVGRVRKGPVKKKNWIALELSDIQQYDAPRKPERFVPVGGQYLRE
jgi:hypothetical protein